MQDISNTRGISTVIGVVLLIVGLVIGVGVGYGVTASSGKTTTTTITGAGQTVTVTGGTGGSTVTVTQSGGSGSTATVTSTVSTVSTVSGSGAGITSPIKIGVLEPLSGALAGPGQGMVESVELAALQVNESGGIDGQPIKLIVDDVQTDPQTALNDMQNLYSVSGVQFFIGPPTTAQVEACEQYATQNHILFLSSSATAGALTNSSAYFFRTVPSDNLQAQAAAAYIIAKGYTRVAINTRNDAFGQGLSASLQALLGSKVVSTILVTSGQSDYTSAEQQIQASNPQVIYYEQFTADGIVMFQNAENLGMQKIPTLGSVEMEDSSFFANPIAAQYMYQTNMTGTSTQSTANSATYQNFATAFKARFGSAPGLFTGTTYDAAMILFTAIARAGVYNAQLVRAQVVPISMSYVGPSGYMAMNSAGDITQVSYTFWQVIKVNATAYGFKTFGSYTPATGINLNG
jgi:branched-chain amino acid transport system substrate-binding protein